MMRTVAWLIEAGLAVSGSYALAVDEGWTVLEAASTGSITEPVEDECLGAVTVGRQRTGQQDLRFGIDDLVEIAARPLTRGQRSVHCDCVYRLAGCCAWQI